MEPCTFIHGQPPCLFISLLAGEVCQLPSKGTPAPSPDFTKHGTTDSVRAFLPLWDTAPRSNSSSFLLPWQLSPLTSHPRVRSDPLHAKQGPSQNSSACPAAGARGKVGWSQAAAGRLAPALHPAHGLLELTVTSPLTFILVGSLTC